MDEYDIGSFEDLLNSPSQIIDIEKELLGQPLGEEFHVPDTHPKGNIDFNLPSGTAEILQGKCILHDTGIIQDMYFYEERDKCINVEILIPEEIQNTTKNPETNNNILDSLKELANESGNLIENDFADFATSSDMMSCASSFPTINCTWLANNGPHEKNNRIVHYVPDNIFDKGIKLKETGNPNIVDCLKELAKESESLMIESPGAYTSGENHCLLDEIEETGNPNRPIIDSLKELAKESESLIEEECTSLNNFTNQSNTSSLNTNNIIVHYLPDNESNVEIELEETENCISIINHSIAENNDTYGKNILITMKEAINSRDGFTCFGFVSKTELLDVVSSFTYFRHDCKLMRMNAFKYTKRCCTNNKLTNYYTLNRKQLMKIALKQFNIPIQEVKRLNDSTLCIRLFLHSRLMDCENASKIEMNVLRPKRSITIGTQTDPNNRRTVLYKF